MHIGYDYGYLYAALCPQTGDLFALLLPTMDSACDAVFLRELGAHLNKQQIGSVRLVMDNAGTHHRTQFNRPYQYWQDPDKLISLTFWDWMRLKH